jgi:hypothetical protein
MSTAAKLSVYSSAKAVTPSQETTAYDFVGSIRGSDHAEAVARVRDAITEDQKKEAKLKLPAVQISGRVTEGRRGKALEEGRFEHSGCLQLDLDADDLNSNSPQEARAILGADPHVMSAFVSPSGTGTKALFSIKPCKTDEEHEAVFLAVEKYIFESYGFKLDGATKDAGRLCFFSHDPDATWRPFPKEFVPPVVEVTVVEVTESTRTKPSDSIVIPYKGFPEPPTNGIHTWLMQAAWWCRVHGGMTEAETVERLRSYDGSLRRPLQATEAVDAARKAFSKELDEAHTETEEIPKDVFPIPAGEITYNESARIIFTAIGRTERIFTRGGIVHEVKISTTELDYLAPIKDERFCSLVEGFGHRVCRRELAKQPDGKMRKVWRQASLPISSAKILLATDAAQKELPPIASLSVSPILTRDGKVLSRGYHAFGDGVLVTSKVIPVEMPIESAKVAIMGLLDDFRFTSPSDRSRAVASILSPALKSGGHIADDFPIDVGEADQSQSGKTLRQKIVCKIYGETPSAIIAPRGGVGSLDEAIATALIKGRPFIALDNFRGRLDSTLLEEATRGHEVVTCRALKTSVEVRTRPFNFQLTTNGAEFTPDVSNRSIITRIKKQEPGYRFKKYPEGDITAHVMANQSFYLGAVFAVIREWQRMDCPITSDTRHSFRGWTQALDGIIQHVMNLPPLLDGHMEQQKRCANPSLQWLRDVINAATPADIGRELRMGDFLNIADDAGINFPAGNPNSKDDPAIRAGRILGKLFKEAEEEKIIIDGYSFSRITAPDYSINAGGGLRKFYTITPP